MRSSSCIDCSGRMSSVGCRLVVFLRLVWVGSHLSRLRRSDRNCAAMSEFSNLMVNLGFINEFGDAQSTNGQC